MTGSTTGIQSARYCRCGNVKILEGFGSTPEIHLRFAFLAELRFKVLRCRCCNTNVAQLDGEGVETIADLDKVTAVTIIDAVNEKELRAQPTYSEIFQMVIPTINNSDDSVASDFPPEIQLTLDTAVQRQRTVTQAQIAEFRTEKQQEFKSWREQARKQATIIARIAETAAKTTSPTVNPPVTITSNQTKMTPNGSELFPKSPVSQYAHPGASPLAAASLTRSQSDPPAAPSPPLAKITPPPVPLSSSLKSPASASMSKPVKRVMFQEPPDDELHSDVEEETQIDEMDVPAPPTGQSIISVDDEMFDFDETIPSVAVESDTTGSQSSSSPASPVQPVRSPLFAPPLSPFRRRSVEKYDLPDDDDPFDDPSLLPAKANGVRKDKDPEDELPALASSRPIAITPPSRSFLAEGLGVDEEDDEGGIKGLIERISLKNTRSGSRASFADQKMLWDIPGDYYRSVTS